MVGIEARNGYDLKTARRSLDLLMREWGNRGLNMWTIAQSSEAFTASTPSASLDSDIIDVLDAVWRTGSGSSQNDRTMTRMSVTQWANISAKNMTGLPAQFYIERTLTPTIYVWPVPEDDGTLVYWKLRRIEDAGAYSNTIDLPPRFLPALTTGLAYYLSMKTPAAMDRIPMLQAEYERQFQLAQEEDRERASVWLVPDLG